MLKVDLGWSICNPLCNDVLSVCEPGQPKESWGSMIWLSQCNALNVQNRKNVMVWPWDGLNRLVCLNTWSSAGGSVLEGFWGIQGLCTAACYSYNNSVGSMRKTEPWIMKWIKLRGSPAFYFLTVALFHCRWQLPILVQPMKGEAPALTCVSSIITGAQPVPAPT